MADPVSLPPLPDRWGRIGAFAVTAAIFALFFMGLYLAAQRPDLPPTASQLLETVKALAMVAAGYWLGSSSSSAKKDDTNAQLGAALATSTPTVVAPTPGPSEAEKALAAKLPA
jgi:hypothetical protein